MDDLRRRPPMEGFSRPGSLGGGEAWDDDTVEGHVMNDDLKQDQEDTEGHRLFKQGEDQEDTEGHRLFKQGEDQEDTEGHRLFKQGEDDDDTEGHKVNLK